MKLALVANEHTDIERLGDEIAELSAQIDAATYRLLVLVAAFDEQGGWHDGFKSCAHWLNWRTGLAMGAARERVRVARSLRDLPRLSEGSRSGELSYSKVRALTRVATVENEEELIAFAEAGTADHVEKLVRLWRRADRDEESRVDDKRRESRSLSLFLDEDGMFVIRGRLEPEVGAALQQALEGAREALHREGSADLDPEETPSQRNADAIGLVAESSLHSAPERFQVVVHVDAEALEAGSRVSAGTSRRIACDASRVEMRHGRDGSVLDVGRRTRTVPPALRRALDHRDGGCRFPGCGSRFCDAHHIEHWANGGATKLDNLVLLCRHHHRAVHEKGFRVILQADHEPSFEWPDGRAFPRVPPTPEIRRPVATLYRVSERAGLKIGPETSLPSWTGERVDWKLAMGTLRRPTSIS